MSTTPEITAARDDVARTRARLEDTYGALTETLTSPVRRAAATLNLAEAVRAHPWPALGAALLAGAVAATTGIDRRAAAAAAATARQAGRKSVSAAKAAPSRTRSAIGLATDTLATRVLTSLIGSLRERPGSATDAAVPDRDAIGFVHSTAPAAGTDSAI